GDKAITTAGVPLGVSGTTNLMKVHIIGDVLAQGQAVGTKYAHGKVVIAKSAKEVAGHFKEGNILVTTGTEKDIVTYLKITAAVIGEEGGLTSHAAVVGLNIGIPVIVGVKNATDLIDNGENVTIDAATGSVHQGHTNVI